MVESFDTTSVPGSTDAAEEKVCKVGSHGASSFVESDSCALHWCDADNAQVIDKGLSSTSSHLSIANMCFSFLVQ